MPKKTLTDRALKGALAVDGVVAYGRFITAVVNFVVIGTVLFFIVRAADRLFTREKKPTEVEVLTEIRDELRRR